MQDRSVGSRKSRQRTNPQQAACWAAMHGRIHGAPCLAASMSAFTPMRVLAFTFMPPPPSVAASTMDGRRRYGEFGPARCVNHCPVLLASTPQGQQHVHLPPASTPSCSGSTGCTSAAGFDAIKVSMESRFRWNQGFDGIKGAREQAHWGAAGT